MDGGTMSFFVDVVNEDSFYENLTLGVCKQLESNPCVKNVQLERRGACDRAALSNWEQKHCCLLGEDLRNFYMSTDGFLLTWSLEISGEEFPIGRMEIKDLSGLKRYVGTEGSCGPGGGGDGGGLQQPSVSAGGPAAVLEPSLGGGSRCKLFELADCADCQVLLAYQLQPDQDEPSVWLHSAARGGGGGSGRWTRLADGFLKYFRIMLVHLGLPLWQMCAAGMQLPTWIEQVYLLVGPHLLQSVSPTSIPSPESALWNDGPINLVDPAVFKNKEHHPQATGPGAGGKQKATAAAGGAGGTSTTTPQAAAASTNARKKSSSSH